MDAAAKQQKIDSAIKAHFGWFERLKKAIASGASEVSPETAASAGT